MIALKIGDKKTPTKKKMTATIMDHINRGTVRSWSLQIQMSFRRTKQRPREQRNNRPLLCHPFPTHWLISNRWKRESTLLAKVQDSAVRCNVETWHRRTAITQPAQNSPETLSTESYLFCLFHYDINSSAVENPDIWGMSMTLE